MDLSKLPRLSETDKHAPVPSASAPEPQQQPAPPVMPYAVEEPGISGQVWLSAALGVIFMLMGGNFARFAIAKLTGRTFHTTVTWTSGARAGQEVDYFELQGYTAYTDTAVFLFGLAMVAEAVMLVAVRRNSRGARALTAIALALSAGMTVFNVIVAGLVWQTGMLPLISLLAAAFGAYMTATQWKMFQQMRFAARSLSA
jgi:hypothetical protein